MVQSTGVYVESRSSVRFIATESMGAGASNFDDRVAELTHGHNRLFIYADGSFSVSCASGDTHNGRLPEPEVARDMKRRVPSTGMLTEIDTVMRCTAYVGIYTCDKIVVNQPEGRLVWQGTWRRKWDVAVEVNYQN